MPNVGLYFPFIHFQSDAWLKMTALYWDHMARIVPEHYDSEARRTGPIRGDSETVRILAGELNFIRNETPRNEIYLVQSELSQELTRYKKELERRYRLPKGVLKRAHRGDGRPRLGQLGHEGQGIAYLHSEKISSPLVDGLCELGVAIKGRGGDLGWVGMHPDLVRVYMTALARAMAARNLAPLADDREHHAAGSGWRMASLFPGMLDLQAVPETTAAADQIKECTLATLAVQSIVPQNLARVPVKTIVALRLEHEESFTLYQDAIRRIADAARTSPDAGAAKAELAEEVRKRLVPSVKRIERALNRAGLKTAAGTVGLNLSMPSVLTWLGLTSPLVMGTAFAATGIGVALKSRGEVVETLAEEPATFLFHVREKVRPKTAVERAMRVVRRFVLGA